MARTLHPQRDWTTPPANIGRNLEDLVLAYIASAGQERLRERVCQTRHRFLLLVDGDGAARSRKTHVEVDDHGRQSLGLRRW